MLRHLENAIDADRPLDDAAPGRHVAEHRWIVCFLVTAFWLFEHFVSGSTRPPIWVVALVALYGIAGAFNGSALERTDRLRSASICVFLVLDPVMLVCMLSVDPEHLAFISPLLLLVVIGPGLRHGLRAMVVAWAITFAAAPMLLTNPFWSANSMFALSVALMVLLGPAVFIRPVQRIHHPSLALAEPGRTPTMQQIAVARSAFLAKVSHELLSPLQGIVSALDVIEMRHAGAFQGDEELIGRMRRASMLLNTQLRDMLTLAKGEAGRLDIVAEPFEACSLVEAMADGIRATAVAKGLRLVVELPAQPLFVRADGARIDQVLTNLVANSVRFTDTGEVLVALQPQGSPVSALRFEVADTGSGIPEALLPTLFSPDEVGNNTARRGQGSGIGLAIVRLLVDSMGGRLEVRSRVGEGTVFSVLIPVTPIEAGD